MKRLILLAVCCVLGVMAEEVKTEPVLLEVAAAMPMTLRANEGYVLLWAEAKDVSLTGARDKVQQKIDAFSAMVQNDFPEARIEVISKNVGLAEKNHYSQLENDVAMAVQRVLIVTIPPDEAMAVKLLDAGTVAGLTPFCADFPFGMSGAVFYGVRDEQKQMAPLYDELLRKLWREAELVAGVMKKRPGQLQKVTRYWRHMSRSEVRRGDFQVMLPVQYVGTDPEYIAVTVDLKGDFELLPQTAPNESELP